MKKFRVVLLVVLALVAVAGLWLWLGKPAQTDMAAYAPADSLVYLEANKPLEVAEAIAGTEAWKSFGSIVGPVIPTPGRSWLREIITRTGLGPIQSVILARAQVAVVLTDLRTFEEGNALNFKSEGVLLIETHTSSSRVRPVFEAGLKTLAEKTYVRPTLQRSNVDGVEFVEWISPDNSRRIVGTLTGSLIVIGTSQAVVRKCLVTGKGLAPSLKDDSELRSVRTELQRPGALTFGFVPQRSSARLLALGLPALLGRAPGDPQFQGLIAAGATKIFGSLAWSSHAYKTGVEDRYLLFLQAPVGDRLKVPFQASASYEPNTLLPNDVYSVSSYNFANPSAAWQSLNGTVSSQLDALSSGAFSFVLRSSLISYGIDDPQSFLATVGGSLMTIKLDGDDERSILVARVKDRAALLSVLERHLLLKQSDGKDESDTFEDSSGEFTAQLGKEFVILGSPEDVRRYTQRGATPDSNTLRRLNFFRSPGTAASVVTYTDDGDRVRSFVASILAAKGLPVTPTELHEDAIASLPYSITETTLTEQRVERITRSPLGQFSSLFALLIPAQPTNVSGTEPR